MSKRCRPLPPLPTEDTEQRALAVWLNIRGLLWAHVPNGGHRAMSEARRLKALGVMPGVPDILIFDPPRLCARDCLATHSCCQCERPACGTAIEMKRRKGGKTTLEQESWLSLLRQRGWAAKVCHGAEEAIDWLTRLGY